MSIWIFCIFFSIYYFPSDLNGVPAIAESSGAYSSADNPFKLNSVNLLSHRGAL